MTYDQRLTQGERLIQMLRPGEEDPTPTAPDARLDTVKNDVASNVALLIARIEARGFAAR